MPKKQPPLPAREYRQRQRISSVESTNQAFNDFLDMQGIDQEVLSRYRDTLKQDSDQFAQVFYDYLLAYPVTAQVLENYRAQGGKIEELVKRQTQHLWDLLSGRIDYASTV